MQLFRQCWSRTCSTSSTTSRIVGQRSQEGWSGRKAQNQRIPGKVSIKSLEFLPPSSHHAYGRIVSQVGLSTRLKAYVRTRYKVTWAIQIQKSPENHRHKLMTVIQSYRLKAPMWSKEQIPRDWKGKSDTVGLNFKAISSISVYVTVTHWGESPTNYKKIQTKSLHSLHV